MTAAEVIAAMEHRQCDSGERDEGSGLTRFPLCPVGCGPDSTVSVHDDGRVVCSGGCDKASVVAALERREKRALRFRPVSQVRARAVRWLWGKRIPWAELLLLAGPEGVGKSTFLAWLIANVTRGTLQGDMHGRPMRVLIAALEDDEGSTLRPRLEAAGADLDLVCIIDAGEDALDLHEHLDSIRAEIERHGSTDTPVGLVVIDPVKSAVGEANPDKERDVRPMLQSLVRVAHECGVTFVVSAHFKKGPEDYAAWRVSGTPAWTQVPRAVLFFDVDPEADDDTEARVIAPAKLNVGRRPATLKARVVTATVTGHDGEPIETGKLVIGEESDVQAGDLRSGIEHGATAEAAAWLREALSGGPVEVRELRKESAAEGHAWGTIENATRKLRVVKRRKGSGPTARGSWSLPDAASAGSAASGSPSGLTPGTPGIPGMGGATLDDLDWGDASDDEGADR